MSKYEYLSLKIPAYLRGELSAQEQSDIERLMSKDDTFAADVRFQKTLNQVLKNNDEDETDTEFGWARLSKAIDEDRAKERPVAANDSSKFGQFWKYAAVCLACVTIGQGLLIGAGKSDENDKYFMAGTSDMSVTLNVELLESSPVKSLVDFLISHDGMIAAGPNENYQYEILFQSIESCDAAIGVLTTNNEIFETFTSCQNG